MRAAQVSRHTSSSHIPNAHAATSKTGRAFHAPAVAAHASSCPAPAQAKSVDGKPIQGVFQFNGSWWDIALNALFNNPGKTILAIAGVSGILLARSLYNRYKARHNQQPPQQPDRNTLDGIAKAMNLDVFELERFLDEGPPGGDYLTVEDIQHSPFLNTVPTMFGLVPPVITEGLIGNDEMTDGAKMNLLFERINDLPFAYTGGGKNYARGFLEKQGDCGTLAAMMIVAARAIGIEGATSEGNDIPHLVAPRPIHGRTKVGNTDQEEAWFFIEHTWVEWKGRHYDMLFMSRQPVPVVFTNGKHEYNHIPYLQFPNRRFVLDKGVAEANGTTFHFDPGHTAIYRRSHQAMQNFIDNNF